MPVFRNRRLLKAVTVSLLVLGLLPVLFLATLGIHTAVKDSKRNNLISALRAAHGIPASESVTCFLAKRLQKKIGEKLTTPELERMVAGYEHRLVNADKSGQSEMDVTFVFLPDQLQRSELMFVRISMGSDGTLKKVSYGE